TSFLRTNSVPLFLPASLSFLHLSLPPFRFFSFFFNDTATTEIYTLSLHDALPIFTISKSLFIFCFYLGNFQVNVPAPVLATLTRSEEHTSELQSLTNLVCRLLLEKKKKNRLRQISSITYEIVT